MAYSLETKIKIQSEPGGQIMAFLQPVDRAFLLLYLSALACGRVRRFSLTDNRNEAEFLADKQGIFLKIPGDKEYLITENTFELLKAYCVDTLLETYASLNVDLEFGDDWIVFQ